MTPMALVNIIIATIGLIMWGMYIYKFTYKWKYGIWAMVYLANVIGMYVASSMDLLTVPQLNNWSSAIRLYVGIFCILIPISIIHYRGPLWTSPPS